MEKRLRRSGSAYCKVLTVVGLFCYTSADVKVHVLLSRDANAVPGSEPLLVVMDVRNFKWPHGFIAYDCDASEIQ